MPWGDSGIYGGCCTGLKPQIFAQNCKERGQFVKMMIIRSHRSISMTSYDHPKIIIRSHQTPNFMASYDHHFHKLPPFPAILNKNLGFEACTACPIYARITPGHQLKRSLLAISYESRITLLI